MYRRVLATLLLPLVLTSQSVTFGHCHGDSSAGHDPRPHIHLAGSGCGIQDDYPSPCGHRHGHHEDASLEEEDQLPSALDPSPCNGSEAIFFGSADPVVVERTKAKAENASSAGGHPVQALPLPSLTEVARLASAYFRHPPRSSPVSCPLYVRHLTLLI